MKDKVVRFYGGANGNKIGIKLDGDVYMIKFPPKKVALKISYTNSCISEYMCCKQYLSERYKKILQPSYLKVLGLEESKPRQNQAEFEIKQ